MTEPRLKPPEVIAAQVAAFGTEYSEHPEDKKYILENLGELAVGGVQDIARVTKLPEYHADRDGREYRIPEGEKRPVASHGDYVSYLKSVGGSRYIGIKGRVELTTAYSEFAPEVETLKAELVNLTDRRGHAAFLGHGANADAFTINKGDKEYVVRIPKGTRANPDTIDSHLAAAVLGKGARHLEQIVAADYVDGVTVAERMPGKEVGSLSIDEIQSVSDKQLAELVDTMVTVYDRGIAIDGKASNILYDSSEGYGILDYQSPKVLSERHNRGGGIGETVGRHAVNIINNMGIFGRTAEFATADGAIRELEIRRANLVVLSRYRSQVEQKLTGHDRDVVLQIIDDGIRIAQQGIDSRANPPVVINKDEVW